MLNLAVISSLKGPEAKAAAFVCSTESHVAAEYDAHCYRANVNLRPPFTFDALKNGVNELTSAIRLHDKVYYNYEDRGKRGTAASTLLHRTSVFRAVSEKDVTNTGNGIEFDPSQSNVPTFVSPSPLHRKIALVANLAAATIELLQCKMTLTDKDGKCTAREYTNCAHECLEDVVYDAEQNEKNMWKFSQAMQYLATSAPHAREDVTFDDCLECHTDALRVLQCLLRAGLYGYNQECERQACDQIAKDPATCVERDAFNRYGDAAFLRSKALEEAEMRCCQPDNPCGPWKDILKQAATDAKKDCLAAYSVTVGDMRFERSRRMMTGAGQDACLRLGIPQSDIDEALIISKDNMWTEADAAKMWEKLEHAIDA